MTVYYTHDADGAYIWKDAAVLKCHSRADARRWLLTEYDLRAWNHATAQIGYGIWPADMPKAYQRPVLVVNKIVPTNQRGRP